MAVGPEILCFNIKDKLIDLEKRIDVSIKEQAGQQAYVTGYLYMNLAATDKLLAASLIPRYLAKGWKNVTMGDSNSYIKFDYDLTSNLNEAVAEMTNEDGKLSATQKYKRKINVN